MGLLFSRIEYLLQAKTPTNLIESDLDSQGVSLDELSEEELSSVTKRNTSTNRGTMGRAEIIEICNLGSNFNNVEAHNRPLLCYTLKIPQRLALDIEKYDPKNTFEEIKCESSCKSEGKQKAVFFSKRKKVVRFKVRGD